MSRGASRTGGFSTLACASWRCVPAKRCTWGIRSSAMSALRELFYLHYRGNGPACTLWDEWLPNALLWPAGGEGSETMAARWAAALASRFIDEEGYVSTHQHNGPAHAQGWPFPRWMDGR